MTRNRRLAIGLVTVCAACAHGGVPARSLDVPRNAVVAAIDAKTTAGAAEASSRFGFDLYLRARVKDQNVIASPVSVAIALAMVAAGARGETQAQMARVLHIDHVDDAHESFAGLFESLHDKGHIQGSDANGLLTLHAANRLWVQQGFELRSEFVALLSDRYKAPLAQVDFGAPDAARPINAWVSEQTRGRITDLVPAQLLDNFTRLVLVNAVYFRGEWEHAFAPDRTYLRPFVGYKGSFPAKMMRQKIHLGYAEIPGARLIELPYRGSLSMVVVLPNAPDGLSSIEDRFGEAYGQGLAALHTELVDLELPPWRTTTELRLAKVLKGMGMDRAFEPRWADFSGISDDTSLYISEVLQKAFIDTDEKGTEAAAATAVLVGAPVAWVPPPPPERVVVFHADHPFLFLIRDLWTDAIVFVGHVVDPR